MSTSLDAPAIPIMLSTDLEDTIAHYTKLGFAVANRWDEYLIVSRDQVELHFFVESDSRHAAGCYLRISDARALYTEWSKVEGLKLFPLVETDYGLVEFAVHDTDGNQIRVGSPT